MPENQKDSIKAESYHYDAIVAASEDADARLQSLATNKHVEDLKEQDEDVIDAYLRTYIERHILLGLQRVVTEVRTTFNKHDGVMVEAQDMALRSARERGFNSRLIDSKEREIESVYDRAWHNVNANMSRIGAEAAGQIAALLGEKPDDSPEREPSNPDVIALNPKHADYLEKKLKEYGKRIKKYDEQGGVRADIPGRYRDYEGTRYRRIIVQMLLGSDGRDVRKERARLIAQSTGNFDNEIFEFSWQWINRYNEQGGTSRRTI